MINNISNNYSTYSATANTKADSTKAKDSSAKTDSSAAYSEPAATYESSSTSSTSKTTSSASSKDRSAIVAQLKADAQSRLDQMQSLVTQMFKKQGITIGNGDDMWKTLASGNFTADAETIVQAKKDIADDGYWGVSQTSDRIYDFALALSGGDEEKMQDMVKAVEKGFKEATKTWGKDLPDISSQTYDAVMKKFDSWFEQNGSSARTSDILK